MYVDLTEPLWPPPPGRDSAPTERLTWYAEVARWAPSKHNSQPWRFVVRDDCLEVLLDDERLLPVSDPMRREAVIACGAAVHIAQVAARVAGHETSVVLLPDGDLGVLARISESGPHSPTQLDHALMTAVATRRTDRGPLNAAVLSPSLPFVLQRAAYAEHASLRLISTPGDRLTLAALVERAERILARDGAVEEEMHGWLREDGDPRADGVSTSSTRGRAQSQRAEFVQRDFSSTRSEPAHDRPGPDNPIVCVLSTAADRPMDWLTAGRALAAVLLRAAMEGAHASYLNQPIEEPALRHQLQDDLALPGPAQLVLRLGAGALVRRTPRRDVAVVAGEPLS